MSDVLREMRQRHVAIDYRPFELGEVCYLDKSQATHTGLPYVGLEDIEAHTSRFLGRIEPTDVKSKTFGFSPRHLLYGRLRPYLNKIIAPNFAGHCSTEIFPILPADRVDRKFLLYWFRQDSIVYRINKTCTGARMPRADLNQVLRFPILLPPLSEQKRVVAILDEAFTDIAKVKANAEKNLKNVGELFGRRREQLFTFDGDGWSLRRIGDLVDFKNGFAFKSSDKVSSSGVQLLRMGNLYQNRLDLSRNPVYYPDDYVDSYNEYLLSEGDIVLSLTGTKGKEDYGYAVRIPQTTECALLLNQRIARVDILNSRILTKEFLLCFLHSRYFLDRLYPTANGTRQGNLSTTTIKTLPIPVCDIHEQRRLIGSLDFLQLETGTIQSIYHQKLTALEELQQSLLHQAFTGQL